MPNFDVTITGLQQLQDRLAKSESTVKKWLQKAVVQSAAKTVEIARTGDMIPWKTGYLNKTFGLPPNGLKISDLVARVGPTAKYAFFVHEGTGPHTIYPVNKKALFWKGADHPVKSVNHPGTKANKFMPRIINASKVDVLKIFDTNIKEALKETAGIT